LNAFDRAAFQRNFGFHSIAFEDGVQPVDIVYARTAFGPDDYPLASKPAHPTHLPAVIGDSLNCIRAADSFMTSNEKKMYGLQATPAHDILSDNYVKNRCSKNSLISTEKME
jgi:hypothetical protein